VSRLRVRASYMVGADLNNDGKPDLVELVSFGGEVPLINITGEVPPPIMANVAADKLARWRNARGIVEMAPIETQYVYERLMDRLVRSVIAYMRNNPNIGRSSEK
jgi:hypothetical protein